MDKELNDRQLVELIRAGDPRVVSFIYEKFRIEFIRWIKKNNKCSHEDACEYYQASVLILYENIVSGKLDSVQSSLKTYLFGIGRNLALQHFRSEQRYQQAKAEYLLDQTISTTENENEARELSEIANCYNQLGAPCKRILDLFYYQKKSMEEITIELGYKNMETAKNLKYKCMVRLRKLMEEVQTTKVNQK